MSILKKPFLLALGLCLVALTTADDLTQKRAEATIRFLADDLLEGRATPSRGLDIAAIYLAGELRAAGWQPANGGSYFQEYTLKNFAPQTTKYTISINGVALEAKDFTFLPIGMDPELAPFQYKLVFAGHGIFAPERKKDDFAGIDVKGKAVVSLYGAPWPLDPAVIHAYDRGMGKAIHAAVRGGKLLVYVSEEFAAPPGSATSAEVTVLRDYANMPMSYLPEFKGNFTMGVCSSLILIPSAFDRTLAKATGGTYSEWQQRLSRGKFKAKALDASIEIRVETKPQAGRASNVVAMLAGTDPLQKDEWIVLSAHYDGLGSMETPPGQDGIYNGADDNASGTAAVLEAARQLTAMKPRRSVLIIFTSGEEMGLLGSAHYSLHPLVPRGQVVANINADMVGRSGGNVYGIAAGCDELFGEAARIGKQKGIDVLPDPNPSWRLIYFVDSYHVARFNVPYVEFFTEMHTDYHMPTDEVRKIRYPELGRIIDVMAELASYYAQGGKKPAFKRPAWFLTAD